MNNTTNRTTSWLDFLNECADLADSIALHYFKSPHLDIQHKQNKTPVSIADKTIESDIKSLLKQSYPDIGFIGEETRETDAENTTRLILDPIDSTQNIIRGIPFFATLVAIEQDNKIIAGVVSSPATKDRWSAEKQAGSFHNKHPIQVSNVEYLDQALALHGSLYGIEAATDVQPLLNILKRTPRQRGCGDYYNHMLVAMGTADFAIDFGLQPWDIAPLKIIIEEAGGIVTDLKGNDSIYNGSIIASNNQFHKQLTSYFK